MPNVYFSLVKNPTSKFCSSLTSALGVLRGLWSSFFRAPSEVVTLVPKLAVVTLVGKLAVVTLVPKLAVVTLVPILGVGTLVPKLAVVTLELKVPAGTLVPKPSVGTLVPKVSPVTVHCCFWYGSGTGSPAVCLTNNS